MSSMKMRTTEITLFLRLSVSLNYFSVSVSLDSNTTATHTVLTDAAGPVDDGGDGGEGAAVPREAGVRAQLRAHGGRDECVRGVHCEPRQE